MREKRSAYTKLSKEQKRELFNVNEGVGVLHVKSAPSCITTIESYIDSTGVMRHIRNGQVVLPIEIARDEEQAI